MEVTVAVGSPDVDWDDEDDDAFAPLDVEAVERGPRREPVMPPGGGALCNG